MKRAVLTIIVCVMTTLAGMAQGKWSLMPKAGVNIGMLGDEGGKGTSPRVGFAVGFEAENWQQEDRTGFSIGLMYSQEGASHTENGTTAHLNLHALNLPLMVNLHVTEGLTIKMGIQPSMLLGANVSASEGDVSASVNISELMNDFSLAIPVGVSYEYKNIFLDARYNIGVLSITKSSVSVSDGWGKTEKSQSAMLSNVIQITLGYRFRLKK